MNSLDDWSKILIMRERCLYSFCEGSGNKGYCKNLVSSTKGICNLVLLTWLVFDLKVKFLEEFNPAALLLIEIWLSEYPSKTLMIGDKLKGLAQ